VPGSIYGPKDDVKSFVKTLPKDYNILDVGPGVGTYADLLSDRKLDAVEVHEPYINQYNLQDKYTVVYNDNVVNFSKVMNELVPTFYDVVIMGDVLEHLTVEEAEETIANFIAAGVKHIIVLVPYMYKQGVCHDNEHEIHQQDDLTKEVFLERYGMFKFISEKQKIGYFRWDRE
jgi:hypothetical protein